jgi:hypothetical protein
MLFSLIKVFKLQHFPAILCASVFSVAVSAAEYSVESELKVTAQHNDNIRLEVDEPLSIFGETINPSVTLQARTEQWATSLNTDLRFSKFNRPGFDSDDQYVTLATQRTGEKSSFSLTANGTHDTTRTSEEFDSGRFTNERRKSYSLAPAWNYMLTDKQQLSLSANLSTVDYSADNFTGYDNGQAFAEWSYSYTESLRFFVRANASRYKADSRTQQVQFFRVGQFQPDVIEQTLATQSDGLGIQLGANYQFTENLSLYGLIGASDTDTEYEISDEFDACNLTANIPDYVLRGFCDLEDQNSTTQLIDTNLSWEQQNYTLSVGYSVQAQPSSNGALLESEQATVKWNYNLSEKNRIFVNGDWGDNQSINEGDDQNQTLNNDREYYSASLGYRYRLTEHWFLGAEARYRYQDSEIVQGNAESIVGKLSISYRPKKLAWSR